MPRSYSRGDFIVGPTHQASAKPAAEKGAYLTGGPVVVKRAPLPPDLEEFSGAAAEADRLAAQRFGVLEQQLADAQARLAEIKKFLRLR